MFVTCVGQDMPLRDLFPHNPELWGEKEKIIYPPVEVFARRKSDQKKHEKNPRTCKNHNDDYWPQRRHRRHTDIAPHVELATYDLKFEAPRVINLPHNGCYNCAVQQTPADKPIGYVEVLTPAEEAMYNRMDEADAEWYADQKMYHFLRAFDPALAA